MMKKRRAGSLMSLLFFYPVYSLFPNLLIDKKCHN